jgi:hypothetical protein
MQLHELGWRREPASAVRSGCTEGYCIQLHVERHGTNVLTIYRDHHDDGSVSYDLYTGVSNLEEVDALTAQCILHFYLGGNDA